MGRISCKSPSEASGNGHSFDIIEHPECEPGFHIRGQKGVLVTRLTLQLISEFDQIKEAPGDPILHADGKHSTRKAQLVTSPSCALANIMKKRWKLRDIEVIPKSLPADQYDKTSGGGGSIPAELDEEGCSYFWMLMKSSAKAAVLFLL